MRHLQIIAKHSAYYEVSPIMSIEEMVGTESMSAWTVTPTKIVKSKC